jgi:hypothetical protein
MKFELVMVKILAFGKLEFKRRADTAPGANRWGISAHFEEAAHQPIKCQTIESFG